MRRIEITFRIQSAVVAQEKNRPKRDDRKSLGCIFPVVSFQSLRKRLDFWLRPWRPLRADQPDDFKVSFDGRALEYEDHLGKLTFQLDWIPGTCGVLSHCGTAILELEGGKRRVSLGSRYDMAARRAKDFLEWGGLQVQVFDPVNSFREATALHQEWHFDKGSLLERA